MKRRILSLLMCVALVFVFAACSSSDNSAGQGGGDDSSATKDTFTVVFIPKSLDNVVYNDLRDSVLAKGKELGVNVEWTAGTTSDAAEQVNVIENCIERGVDAIAVAVNDAVAVADVFQRARDAGIIVACFDSDAENSARQFYVGTDNVELGRIAGQEMVNMLPDGGDVAIMIATPGMVNIQERADGFTEVVEAAGIHVRMVLDCNTNTQIAVDRTNQYCAANPDLAGFFFTHGLTHYADTQSLTEYIEWGKNGGKSVAIDAVYPMYAFFKEGMAGFTLIDQAWDQMGIVTLDIIMKMLNDEDPGLPANKIVHTGTKVIDESNWEGLYSQLEPW